MQTPKIKQGKCKLTSVWHKIAWLGRVISPSFLWMFSVPYSPLGSALEIPRGRVSSSEWEEFVCSLSQWRVCPSPKYRICFAKGEVWAGESLCSSSFFLFCFLVFIVMMTYGNYLHRSMLCCTEWKRWSPGSIVPDALCKQPAGFAFSFFLFSFFPLPLSLFRERLG